MPPRRKGPARYKQQSLFSHFSSDPPSPNKTSRRATKQQSTISQRSSAASRSEFDFEISEVDVVRASPSKKSTILLDEHKQSDSDSSDVGRIRFESRRSSSRDTASTDHDEDDERPLPSSSQPSRKHVLDLETDDDDELKKAPRRIKTLRQVEEADSENDSSPPKKPRLLRRKATTSETSEDEDDILDGIDEDKIIDESNRKPAKRNRFKENLEKLKKKKQGVWAKGSDSGSESEFSGDDDGSILPGAKPHSERTENGDSGSTTDDESNSEEELDDFIVDDDGDAGEASLPAVFSMRSHQDLIHHFKVICQFHVHLAVTVDRSRKKRAENLMKDEYFSLPLAIARRKLSDLRDSIVSSVWRPDFRKALLKYPVLNVTMLDFSVPTCDACHLGGRLSTFTGRMDGDPYDPKTFEPVKALTSSEEDSDEEDEGEKRKPEFQLGRFCARRTQTYHQLSHWEHELFRSLYQEVEELQNTGRGFVKVSYNGTVPPPDDTSDADQVMEWMDDRGVINVEWMKLKALMDKATNLELDVKRGGQED